MDSVKQSNTILSEYKGVGLNFDRKMISAGTGILTVYPDRITFKFLYKPNALISLPAGIIKGSMSEDMVITFDNIASANVVGMMKLHAELVLKQGTIAKFEFLSKAKCNEFVSLVNSNRSNQVRHESASRESTSWESTSRESTPVTLNMPTSVKNNTCGMNLTWVLENNTLTISGNGDMTDFVYVKMKYDDGAYSAPWYKDIERIYDVIIQDGVTSIGDHAFEAGEIKSVTIAGSVTTIGENAFFSSALKKVKIPASVKVIRKWAFAFCEELDIYYDGTEEEWNAIKIDDQNGALAEANIHFSKQNTFQFCPKCGFRLPANARFCPGCGSPL